MILQITAICLWVVFAFVMAKFPTRDSHWRLAYLLMALGVPILIWVTLSVGAWLGALFALIAAMVFRWPLYFLLRWVRRTAGI